MSMNRLERQPEIPQEEDLNPRHFYAAYVFEGTNERPHHIAAVIATAREFNYPVRYWWLSDAMTLDGTEDRLIVCVHHDSLSDEAGLDVYDMLKEKDIEWDFLEAASVWEYRAFGQVAEGADAIRTAEGALLFPSTADKQR
jgi:hypothetical protein